MMRCGKVCDEIELIVSQAALGMQNRKRRGKLVTKMFPVVTAIPPRLRRFRHVAPVRPRFGTLRAVVSDSDGVLKDLVCFAAIVPAGIVLRKVPSFWERQSGTPKNVRCGYPPYTVAYAQGYQERRSNRPRQKKIDSPGD